MLKHIFKRLIIGFLLVFLFACSDKVQLQPLTDNSTVLAFGDSLTYGTGTSRDKTYPAVLERHIQRKVINAGKPGEISAEGVLRLPMLIKQYQPELIIICHGGNDILRKIKPDKTRANIQQMITLAKQNNIQVILIGVPKLGILLNTAPIYDALAAENQLPYLSDIIGHILSKAALKSDRVHPNADGYQLLAREVTRLLIESGAIEIINSPT
ncbi:MAG: arylesterase [Gammaproteobacteria bacterium]|nr:MAG: arylesterase [Gammaproteobacteria bacterium]